MTSERARRLRTRTDVRGFAGKKFQAMFGTPVPDGWVESWRAEYRRLHDQEVAARRLAQQRHGVTYATWRRHADEFFESQRLRAGLLVNAKGSAMSPLTAELIARTHEIDVRKRPDDPHPDETHGISLVPSEISEERTGDVGPLVDLRHQVAFTIWAFELLPPASDSTGSDEHTQLPVFLSDGEIAALCALVFPTEVHIPEDRDLLAASLLKNLTTKVKQSRRGHRGYVHRYRSLPRPTPRLKRANPELYQRALSWEDEKKAWLDVEKRRRRAVDTLAIPWP